MSSHVHWSFLAGRDTLERVFKPLHSGFATWLNLRAGRPGPVFAQRPKTVWIPYDDTLRLIAYLHNNPVRAACVDHARSSFWTSHRAFTDPDQRLPWLDYETALRLSGFEDNPSDRERFDEYVTVRGDEPRDPILSGDHLGDVRMHLRQRLGSSIELGSARVQEGGHSTPIFSSAPEQTLDCFDTGVDHLLTVVEQLTGVDCRRIQSRDRTRAVARARRLFVVAGYSLLGRTLTELAGRVGISVQAASKLARELPELLGDVRARLAAIDLEAGTGSARL